MNIANFVFRNALIYPDRPAVAHGTQHLHSYRDLANRTAQVAGMLKNTFNLSIGDRVALWMKNTPEFIEILNGIWAAGMVAVPINNKLHPKEIAYLINDSQSKLIFATHQLVNTLTDIQFDNPSIFMIDTESEEYRSLLRSALPARTITPRHGHDLAWLFYTSGTTGKSKGVMLSHQNLLTMTLSYLSSVDPVDSRDSILYAAPMSHGAGLYNMVHTLMGARHLIPESGFFDAQEIFTLGKHFGNLSLFAAPTMVRRMVEHCANQNDDPTGIKTIVYGGGPMYIEDMLRALDVMGNRFVQIYGQGESPMTITSLARNHHINTDHPRYLERLGSVGTAQATVEVRIADKDGHTLPAGEIGEILVRGQCVMQGYWNHPEATQKTLRDGWLYTGDMGVMDSDGFITLKDRSKDMIITGGSNVYPREVEEVLLTHPSIAEVSVVGRHSQEWGEDIVAFIVLNPGASFDPEALDQHCLAHIARFKRPKDYFCLKTLPKNNYGKILKTELRTYLENTPPC